MFQSHHHCQLLVRKGIVSQKEAKGAKNENSINISNKNETTLNTRERGGERKREMGETEGWGTERRRPVFKNRDAKARLYMNK